MSFLLQFGIKVVSFEEGPHGDVLFLSAARADSPMVHTVVNLPVVPVASDQHENLTDNTTSISVPTVRDNRLSVATTNIEITDNADSPATAVDKLVYGANQFSSEEVVIAKGFYASVVADTNVVNLYLHRTHGEDQRVAQIMVDGHFYPLKNKNAKAKDHVLYLYSGVHKLAADELGMYLCEFYFLSRTGF